MSEETAPWVRFDDLPLLPPPAMPGFVALAAATLMLAFSFAPALSLSIGANIALVFAIGMMLRAACLSEDGIERTEAWRILQPQERPAGDAGRRLARDELQDVLLRFREGRGRLWRSSFMGPRSPFP